jgi:hypothetical protein
MKVVPLTIKAANKVVADWHRHNKPTVGGRFAIGAEEDGILVGVAIIGRPVARMLDGQFIAEVTRLCVIDGAPKNTCSFLYGAARRAWFTMGGKRLITYTLKAEPGSSLRGAGWQPTEVKVNKDNWMSRNRDDQAVFNEPKIRWEAANTLERPQNVGPTKRSGAAEPGSVLPGVSTKQPALIH